MNTGPDTVDLIAIGSPHASLTECQRLAKMLAGRPVRIATIVTAGRNVIALAQADGTLAKLAASGVQVIPDLCWCSITVPNFPAATQSILTNSAKYAHYGPGLSGRALRFGSLADCAAAATSGHISAAMPGWLMEAKG